VANKAAFLDRDGTINRNVPYCSKPDDFELLSHAAEAIKLLNDHNFIVVVITNQSGIGRGYFSEETLAHIHDRMKKLLGERSAHIDAIYYCPHHPDEGCQCRKPKPRMVLRAAKDLDINLKQSYVIGDGDADIEMGRQVVCKATVRIGRSVIPNCSFNALSLYKAVKWVIDQ